MPSRRTVHFCQNDILIVLRTNAQYKDIVRHHAVHCIFVATPHADGIEHEELRAARLSASREYLENEKADNDGLH
jgi:hypothetical protein